MAKPLTIYGRPLSPYVTRVLLAARAKGFAWELTVPEGGIKTPEYLKLHPFGKVPVLRDGKTTMYESSVIVEYLDAKTRTKKLVPRAAKAAGLARLVGAVAAEYVQTPAIKLFRLKRGTSPEAIDRDAALADLEKGFDALEHVIVRGKYAGGSKFGIADCYAAPALMFGTAAAAAFNRSDCLASRPRVAKYWAAIQKDKLAKPLLDDMRAAIQQALSAQTPR